MDIHGSLKGFQLTGGNFKGQLTIARDLGKFAVTGGKAGGGWFGAGANVNVGGMLKSTTVAACETDNGGEEFGILAGGFGKLSIGSWKLTALDLPFDQGDLCVELLT
jgi:hypothetical protein